MLSSDITSGYVVVRPSRVLYESFEPKLVAGTILYGLPISGTPWDCRAKRYLGVDRRALLFADGGGVAAVEQIYDDLENAELAEGGLVICREWIDFIFTLLPVEQFELLWIRTLDARKISAPIGFRSLGFDACFPSGDMFSAIKDSMFYPYWNGTDEGQLFSKYYAELNEHGLFDDPVLAQEFLAYYRRVWDDEEYCSVSEIFTSASPWLGQSVPSE